MRFSSGDIILIFQIFVQVTVKQDDNLRELMLSGKMVVSKSVWQFMLARVGDCPV